VCQLAIPFEFSLLPCQRCRGR